LVLLDEPAHLFDSLRRAVAIVAADEVDLATVDTSAFVDHGEIRGVRLPDCAVARGRALYGIVLPILISVSLTPGPYCPPAEQIVLVRMRHAADRPAGLIHFLLMIPSQILRDPLSDARGA
jgi:hypothetical protein